MLDKKILNSLVCCHTQEEIYELLKNEVFPDSDSIKFSDDIMRFVTSSGQYANINISLNSISKLALKTILLLKLHGHIGRSPKNSGIRGYCTTLTKLIRDIFPNVKERMDEVSEGKFKEYLNERVLKVSSRTVREDINKIYDWVAYANPLLPFILRLDERVINESEITVKIRQKSIKEHYEYIRGVGGTSSKLFPLNSTKAIMREALNYIDNYTEEILLIAPIYLNRKNEYNDYQERKYIVDYFKESICLFKEPDLKQLQEDSTSIIAHKVKKPAMRILKTIRQLESACIFVGLSLTGYRAYEFTSLPRHPEFRHEEHSFLTRLVTKTSLNGKAEEIEMPIPLAAKNAIEIISKLTCLRDGKKTGKLLMSSWEHLDVKEITISSQRLLHAIKYFCINFGLPTLTPHMTRHTMAFIIAYFSEGDSLELTKLFLGHKSITMTLRYLGHYNQVYHDAMLSFEQNEGAHYAKQISNEIRHGKKLYGKNGERIMDAQFMGTSVEEFADLIEIGLIEMVKVSQYVILNTPYCYCIYDKSTPSNNPCQQGVSFSNIEDSKSFIPLTGQCRPGACNNALFIEENILHLQANQIIKEIPEEFKKRISENTYILNDQWYQEFDSPIDKIIKQYNKDQNLGEGA